jgi:hypothetical protein
VLPSRQALVAPRNIGPRVAVAAACVSILALAACGDGGVGPRPDEASSLTVSPDSLGFTAAVGLAAPAPHRLFVVPQGGGSTAWSATSGATWLGVAPAQGAGYTDIAVTVDHAGLEPGEYAGSVTIQLSAATGAVRVVPVGLRVAPTPPRGIIYESADSGFASILSRKADGSQPRLLTRGRVPSISRDGEQMLMWRGGFGLYRYDFATARDELIYPAPDWYTGVHATWSPDATRIAVSNCITVRQLGTPQSHLQCEIRVMDPDGRNDRLLLYMGQTRVENIRWSPDGTEIAFSAVGEVFMVPADGGPHRKILQRNPGTSWYLGAWSPNGDRLVVREQRQFGLSDSIHLVTRDGSWLRMLDAPPGKYGDPDWSPDGHWLVVPRGDLTGGGPFRSLWLIAADGSQTRQLTEPCMDCTFKSARWRR